MTELVTLIALGGALLTLFAWMLIRGEAADRTPADVLRITRILDLPALSFRQADRLFDASDFEFLAGHPGQVAVTERLRRDRRILALGWLRQLQLDTLTLWRFRGVITRCGLSPGLGDEFRVAFQAIHTLTLLALLRSLVYAFGPFTAALMVQASVGHVEQISRACARPLEAISAAKLSEVQNRWLAVSEG